jgi:histidine ammonia-lyase
MIELSGTGRIGDVVVLADRRDRVSVSAKVVDAVARRYDDAADLSTRFATYGRTTGVGADRVAAIPADDPDYGMRLLRSHAVDAGDPLTARTVRSMLAVRLMQLCVPGAGLDPAILDGSCGCSTTTHCQSSFSTPPSAPATSRRSPGRR